MNSFNWYQCGSLHCVLNPRQLREALKKQDQKDLSNLPSYRVINWYSVMFSLWRSKYNWNSDLYACLNLAVESWIDMQWCVHCEGQDPTEPQPSTCLNPALRSSNRVQPSRLGLNPPQPASTSASTRLNLPQPRPQPASTCLNLGLNPPQPVLLG